jgi:hypothetical protein
MVVPVQRSQVRVSADKSFSGQFVVARLTQALNPNATSCELAPRIELTSPTTDFYTRQLFTLGGHNRLGGPRYARTLREA